MINRLKCLEFEGDPISMIEQLPVILFIAHLTLGHSRESPVYYMHGMMWSSASDR
jgi:hypothetical protein